MINFIVNALFVAAVIYIAWWAIIATMTFFEELGERLKPVNDYALKLNTLVRGKIVSIFRQQDQK